MENPNVDFTNLIHPNLVDGLFDILDGLTEEQENFLIDCIHSAYEKSREDLYLHYLKQNN